MSATIAERTIQTWHVVAVGEYRCERCQADLLTVERSNGELVVIHDDGSIR